MLVSAALLVGTHLFAFLLIPAAMYVFYSRIDELKDARARSPFVALMGMSFMMVSRGPRESVPQAFQADGKGRARGRGICIRVHVGGQGRKGIPQRTCLPVMHCTFGVVGVVARPTFVVPYCMAYLACACARTGADATA